MPCLKTSFLNNFRLISACSLLCSHKLRKIFIKIYFFSKLKTNLCVLNEEDRLFQVFGFTYRQVNKVPVWKILHVLLRFINQVLHDFHWVQQRQIVFAPIKLEVDDYFQEFFCFSQVKQDLLMENLV